MDDVERLLGGVKLLFLVHAPPAGMLGFAVGYAIRCRDAGDRTQALAMIPVFLAATLVSLALGRRWARRAEDAARRTMHVVALVAGLALAPIVALVTISVLY